jgi:hypothetical protein
MNSKQPKDNLVAAHQSALRPNLTRVHVSAFKYLLLDKLYQFSSNKNAVTPCKSSSYDVFYNTY